jgi:long-chain fatty acid transport protein
MKRTILSIFIFLSGWGLIGQPSLRASGIQLYEIGTRDVGLASAGWAARAQDASTLFKNPAGMSFLKDKEIEVGTQLLYGNFGFTSGSSTTVSGNNGGNPVGLFPGGSFFYVRKVSEKVKFGMGALSYFGLAQKYDDGWVGRYYVKEAALLGFTLMPAVSYQVNEKFSIGAGLNMMIGYLNEKVAINNLGSADGEMALKDKALGVGANAGFIYSPVKGTRLGVTYLSPVSLNFSDTPEFTGLGPVASAILNRMNSSQRGLDLGMKVPQSVMTSVYHEVTPRVALMGNIGWQNWAQFGKVDVMLAAGDSQNLVYDCHYKDTWHGAFGAQFQVKPKWMMTAGFAYDSSPVNDADRTLSLPMGKTTRYGTGLEWQKTEKFSLGLAYELAWMGDMPVDQNRGLLAGHVQGVFGSSAIHFFALHFNWR